MSLGRRARVAARLCGPLTGLQSLMMDEHCPLAGVTSDRRQTTADACSAPTQRRSDHPPAPPPEGADGMKPSQQQREKHSWSPEVRVKRMRGGGELLFLFSSLQKFRLLLCQNN